MIRDLPFSSNSESEFDSVEAVEALRKTCQRMGFRLTLLYVRASALEELQTALNTCIGLLPSFLAPVLVDKDGKAMDTAPLGNRAHLFIADLMRYVEFAKKSEDPDASTRSQLVVNLVRLASEVGRLLLSDCASVEECAHLDGRDLISEQKVAAAAAIEAKESRKVKELRSKVSENFLSERTRHEQRQAQAETALLETHKSKLGPVSERERARRARGGIEARGRRRGRWIVRLWHRTSPPSRRPWSSPDGPRLPMWRPRSNDHLSRGGTSFDWCHSFCEFKS